MAKKRGVIQAVPEIEWLKAPDPEFDLLDFEEAERLLAGSDGEWRTMILVALRAGMRQGEILALQSPSVTAKLKGEMWGGGRGGGGRSVGLLQDLQVFLAIQPLGQSI